MGGGGWVGGEIRTTSSDLVSSAAARAGVQDLDGRLDGGWPVELDPWGVGAVLMPSIVGGQGDTVGGVAG